MVPVKDLCWGDNGIHEFWESGDHELLIIRVHSRVRVDSTSQLWLPVWVRI